MINYKDELTYYTKVLLDKNANYGELKSASDSLYDLYKSASNLQEDDENVRKAVYLEYGKAIDTLEAGMCVKEFMRTKCFVLGIYEGILEAKKRFPNQTINILYSGTGPFAALILPLTTVFGPEEIQVTMLEINENTLALLKNTLTAFDVWEYVDDIILTDAVKYSTNKKKPIHMLITETMQRAFVKEPHVSIVLNLIDQVEENGILIPESVVVDAVLFDDHRNQERMLGVEGAEKDYFLMLGRVMDLNFNTAREYSATYKKSQVGDFEIDCPTYDIPNPIELRFGRINLMTTIKVFGDCILNHYECSLNLPYEIFNLNRNEGFLKNISLKYVISSEPKFVLV